jgi:hypothetical protein
MSSIGLGGGNRRVRVDPNVTNGFRPEVVLTDESGNAITFPGSGADATAANQVLQLAKETAILAQLDLTLTGLRDALRGASTGTLEALRLLLVTQAGYLDGVEGGLAALTAQLPASLGIKTAAASLSVAPASDARFSLTDISEGEYETVAASQTNQALGASGATGDYLAGVLIVPASTSPGAVTIKDGANAAITIFPGGASSVSNLVPFFVPLGIKSVAGAWQVTTGANVSAIGTGNFV